MGFFAATDIPLYPLTPAVTNCIIFGKKWSDVSYDAAQILWVSYSERDRERGGIYNF